MAFLNCDIDSQVLGMDVCFHAIVPGRQSENIRTLYLLHGLSDSHSKWSRFTSIERYAEQAGIAVIMPDAQKSFYTDMAYGDAFYTFISEELITITRNLFHLSNRREDTFVAGNSMGGYGAYRLALSRPDIFGGAASFSGALEAWKMMCQGQWQRQKELILGDVESADGTDVDLYHLANELIRTGAPKPRLYQACGTEDFLYQSNTNWHDFIADKGFDYLYEQGPGDHTWAFWDTYIQRAIPFLFSR